MQLGIFIALMVVFALSEARSPPGPVACTADWSPVCGVDNETYDNACMARAKYAGTLCIASSPVFIQSKAIFGQAKS